MAKAPAGMTGGLSITDMRELMRATDEIDTVAAKTAKQFKVVTDRTDECRRLLESVMGSTPVWMGPIRPLIEVKSKISSGKNGRSCHTIIYLLI